MSKAARRFKRSSFFFILILGLSFPGYGQEADFKKTQTGLYRDVFDQNMYHEGTNLLHLDRLYRKIFRKKIESSNVNIFDEVPDNSFFTNRHSRKPLSSEELEKGYQETSGPDQSGDLTVIKGKFEGVHPGFFIQDAKSNQYLVKFDYMDSFELATSAEVIASRFYYAIGYNVPQYTIALFSKDKLKPAPDAYAYDDTGFRKQLTPKRLEDYLISLPEDANGSLRASASKILAGTNKGYFEFTGKRRGDAQDPVPHKDRREIRALRVFSTWLNNYDVRESNTLDILKNAAEGPRLKHYLIDFNGALGSGAGGAKPPMVTHEHLIDYGESFKSFLSLGFWENPWRKRMRLSEEAGEKPSAAVGYLDNRLFDPGRHKIQLPYFAFKDLTGADGFWASKIMMKFTDEDIKAMVKAGALTNPSDSDYVSRILIERRDLIAKYWFEKVSPLDEFQLGGGNLTFNDLSVEYGFAGKENQRYLVEIFDGSGKRKLDSTQESQANVSLAKVSSHSKLRIRIRAERPGASKANPPVTVDIEGGSIAGIFHGE